MFSVSVNLLSQQIQQAIVSQYGPSESKAIAHAYLSLNLGISTLDILLDKQVEQPKNFTNDLARLAAGIPLQYVTGKTYFCDRIFSLNAATLIPRPETEELVAHALQCIGSQAARVLDIGTGSGCIAISIALSAPQTQVTGWDVASEALCMARENANQLAANVEFKQQDVFSWRDDPNQWDLIVSNPPYVLASEKATMAPHVLDYEPHLALFVPDDDPLIFYRAIGELAAVRLMPGAHLCFEINRAFGAQHVALAEAQGFVNVRLLQDFQGNDRILIAQRSFH
jgi:release factor glutamine methyltransferase